MAEPPLRNIVVVGASLAGLRGAESLRNEGFDGRLTLVGSETHLPYDRPPLSKQVLAGEWSAKDIQLRDEQRYQDLELDWRLGVTATGLDLAARRVELEGGSTSVSFDGLVIATGALPRRLPGVPEELPGLFTLRTLEDSLALSAALESPGASVVVVGAGFIGSEVASTCRGRGADVTVVEALPTPLTAVLGEEMGQVCAGLHRDFGVRLLCGVGVIAIEGKDRVTGVVLSDDRCLPADVVVVGVGVAPAVAWLEGSPIELSNGVVCDSGCFAGPRVVAAGDVARWFHPTLGEHIRVEHWTNATEQGAVAGKNLLRGPDGSESYDPVPYFWSDQYSVKIQYVGHARPDDKVQVVHGSVEERRFVAVYGSHGHLTGALGFSRPRQLMAYRRLLAEGASWEEALELEVG